MARAAYAMLAFVAFTCYVVAVSATGTQEAVFNNAQEKNYAPVDPPTSSPTSSPTSCPPPPPSHGSCSFWSKAHPSSLPSLLEFLTPILDIFSSIGGSSSSSSSSAISSIFGSQMTLHQGLTNTRTDGYGALLRQGSAAVLNSYTVRDFPYTTVQVKSNFQSALVSQQAAFVMATKFENANLGYSTQH